MRLLIDRCVGRRLAAWLSNEGHDVVEARTLGRDPGDRSLLEIAESSGRSPLAFPFLSFTDESTKPATRYMVVKSDSTGKAGYSIDIIAAVPSGRDARRVWPTSHANGWWHKNDVNGATVEIVNG